MEVMVREDSHGYKDDNTKARMDLLPPDALVEIAKVFTRGADKYTARNWERGMDWGRLYAATMRHLNAFWSGEDIDNEWGYSHLAHAGCSILMLLSTYLRNIGTDSRQKIVTNDNGSSTPNSNTTSTTATDNIISDAFKQLNEVISPYMKKRKLELNMDKKDTAPVSPSPISPNEEYYDDEDTYMDYLEEISAKNEPKTIEDEVLGISQAEPTESDSTFAKKFTKENPNIDRVGCTNDDSKDKGKADHTSSGTTDSDLRIKLQKHSNKWKDAMSAPSTMSDERYQRLMRVQETMHELDEVMKRMSRPMSDLFN